MNVARRFRGIIAAFSANRRHVVAVSNRFRACAAIAFFLTLVSVGTTAEQVDQSNLPEWAGGWTHINPADEGLATMWQTFTAGCPNLTAVEIDILTISPGSGDDVLTIEITRDGVVLGSAECSVEDGFDGLLRFEFPKTVPLVPEQVYELRIRDTGKTRFGWKYGSNTYERGSRYVGAQQRPTTDWFFRTYASVELAMAKYSGGTGKPNDPYQIATAADLIALGETPEDYDKHFILTADIDLDPNLPGRKVFDKAVIAPDVDPFEAGFQGPSFTGDFDGNGRGLSHLTIQGADHLGLFGQLEAGAQIKNLRLRDVLIAGMDYVGGLAGFSRADIAMCQSSGTVGGNRRVGGLVGRNWGHIAASGSTTTVSGAEDVGGLTANNYGSVTDCYSTGAVTGSRDVGLLVGENYGRIATCYSAGTVVGVVQAGGLIGYNWGEARVDAAFWDTETNGQTGSAGGEGKTTTEMQTAKTFLDAGWDFVGETANGTEDIWWILEGQDYPRLAWGRVLFDDFEDGKAEPLWMLYEPQPDRVRLTEVDGRLEVEAVVQDQDVDAIYVARGWRLDATKAFALRVDLHFSKQGGDNGRVTFGLTPSLDPSGMRWAEMEAGCFDTEPFYLYEVRDGAWVREQVTSRSVDDGTLYLSYNPGVDELYFSYAGYGKANAWQIVPGLLKGRWATEAVYVTLSGGSQGMALGAGDAWLDNFVLNAGVVQSVEPAAIPNPDSGEPGFVSP